MKKEVFIMKKITAVFLAIVMLFSAFSFCVTAADENGNVARMWICAEKHKDTGINHVFLYFENLTDETIKVGKYSLGAYDTVSVGCFGTEGPRGAGIYYNNESALTHYNSLVGLSTELDEGELRDVTNKLNGTPNWWDPIFNCYYVAARVWNAGGGKSVPFLIFPGFARYFIGIKGGGSMNIDLFVEKPIYKQTEL